ncbi:MAG: TIM barrel protein [Candidatus Aenigmarchaeota archaeon]|nr:TIM barrel protein [Candidatus Aenigmarchaeota archaeon]
MFQPKKLFFGTAGRPVSTEGDTIAGIKQVRKLNLDAMELEFVHSVNISKEKAPAVRETAKKSNVLLTCHGQYYINLASPDKKKEKESVERILKAARIASLCGAWSLCFHAAFYQGKPKEEVYNTVRKHLQGIVKTLRNEGHDLWLRPETTGRVTQFGELDELLRLSSDVEQVLPCVDFSHLHARSNGAFNSYEEFSGVLAKIEKELGKAGIKNMHIHVSGIAYGEKGEKHHLNLKESDLRWKEIMRALKDFGAHGVVISESPNIEDDALLMKEGYNKLN